MSRKVAFWSQIGEFENYSNDNNEIVTGIITRNLCFAAPEVFGTSKICVALLPKFSERAKIALRCFRSFRNEQKSRCAAPEVFGTSKNRVALLPKFSERTKIALRCSRSFRNKKKLRF